MSIAGLVLSITGLVNFKNPIWRETGRELQTLADTFAHSNERILVRERAAQVDISTIDKDKFFAMLKELFQVRAHITKLNVNYNRCSKTIQPKSGCAKFQFLDTSHATSLLD